MSNILLMLAHSIEESDQLKLLSELGHDCFSLGGYIDPCSPHDSKRPALLNVPFHAELKEIVDKLGEVDNLEAAKRHIPDDILAWADVIICHHHEGEWLIPQWNRIKHKRVIWRTVGQSVESNEGAMAPLRKEGLQIVRYSPKEKNIPGYIGEDAIIRFYKDPDEWNGWTGEESRVINFTQHFSRRDPYTNWGFWNEAVRGIDSLALGPGSETGTLSFDDMKEALRRNRAYLYTGTQPASLTLGLLEALMTGIPVVSIGPAWMNVFPYGPLLFEGHEIARLWSNSPNMARKMLQRLLDDKKYADLISRQQREFTCREFSRDVVASAWRKFLG